jgi:hypothetical protein
VACPPGAGGLPGRLRRPQVAPSLFERRRHKQQALIRGEVRSAGLFSRATLSSLANYEENDIHANKGSHGPPPRKFFRAELGGPEWDRRNWADSDRVGRSVRGRGGGVWRILGPVEDLDDTEFVPVSKDENWRSLRRAALPTDRQRKGKNGDTRSWATLLRRRPSGPQSEKWR